MTFSQLSTYFEKLEATSSRLALIDILADLFKHVAKQEIDKVIYLMQGRIAPFYEATEIGMADKTIATALAQAFGEKREHVLKMYARKGDMGLVAQELNSKFKIQNSKLNVEEVFNTLTQIAKTSGEGTVGKRTAFFADLLRKLDSTSVKYLARVGLGNLRLGIGDPTVLDGLALAILKDRYKRKLLEKAYNETSDLGIIGKTLLEGGLKAVQKLTVTVGRPIRSELCERLPDPAKIMEKFGGLAHVQYKFDGFRTELHKNGDEVRIFSRNLEETTAMLPEIVEGVKKQVKAETVILDAEALAFNPASDEFLPFQETTKRRRKYGVEEMSKSMPLKSFVFDIMYLNGQSLIDLPLKDRLKKLAEVVKGDEVLIPQPGEMVNKAQRLQEIFDDAITKGLEGLVVKKPDSPYQAGGRNFNWVKLKRHSSGELKDTIDVVLLGYIFGRGKRAEFGAGSLLVGVYDQENDEFVTVSKIGTGLTDEEWKEVHKRADKISVDKKPARVNAVMEHSVWIKP
ncbi:MAG: ATP-dependent DNA ligase, partial [Candidatus Levybacteria bacterium]|nr:ATP-dependent DNA ligase [Candidatus Levybacteria bacterium]